MGKGTSAQQTTSAAGKDGTMSPLTLANNNSVNRSKQYLRGKLKEEMEEG